MIDSKFLEEEYIILKKNKDVVENYIDLNQVYNMDRTLRPISLNPKYLSEKLYNSFKKDLDHFPKFFQMLVNNKKNVLKYFSENCKEDRLVSIFLKVIFEKEKRIPEKKPICIFSRFDYLLDRDKNNFMQTEFQITPIGGGYESYGAQKSVKMIRNFLFKKNPKLLFSNYDLFFGNFIKKTFSLYNNKNASIMILDHDDIVSIEIRKIERLLILLDFNVVLVNLKEINKNNYYLDKNNKLFFKNREIGVIYFRTLFNVNQFSEEVLEFYIQSEVSKCITCPTSEFSLFSLKPIQHLLYQSHLLKKYDLEFLKENPFCNYLTPTYKIEDFNCEKQKMIDFIRKDGLENFLIKSFQEAGACEIINGKEIFKFIEENEINVLKNFILVKKIKPELYTSIIYRKGKIEKVEDSITEFSFWSSIIFNQRNQNKKEYNIIYKGFDNWLARSKNIKNMKGGLSIGISFLDTIALKK